MTRVGVIFGGANSEHEVSVASARDVVAALRRLGYEVALLGIDRGGRWHQVGDVDDLAGSSAGTRLPELDGIDVAMPILHGRFGEDGTVQGMLELAGIPYTGCGVLSSALAMDKRMTASVLDGAGIPTIPAVALRAADRGDAASLTAHLGFPLFVKPNRSGSSVGVTRVESGDDLDAAIGLALEHDDIALVQPEIVGDEVDLGILQRADGSLVFGAPLRVRTTAQFFDYESKYSEGGVDFEIPARLDPDVEERLHELAAASFAALQCDGIARVDFFVGDDGSIDVNEVNTLPGLTSHSQLPQMFAALGHDLGFVAQTLLDRALARR